MMGFKVYIGEFGGQETAIDFPPYLHTRGARGIPVTLSTKLKSWWSKKLTPMLKASNLNDDPVNTLSHWWTSLTAKQQLNAAGAVKRPSLFKGRRCVAPTTLDLAFLTFSDNSLFPQVADRDEPTSVHGLGDHRHHHGAEGDEDGSAVCSRPVAGGHLLA